MRKSHLYVKGMLILGLTVGVSHAMQPMPYGGGMPYGGHPGMMPYGGQPGMNPYNQKMQRKAYKRQMKQEQMRQFFAQNPRASKDQWEYYWKNFKRMHGLD